MRLDHAPRYVEAKSQAAHARSRRRLRAREAAEDPRQILGIDAFAVICHGDLDFVLLPMQPHDDLASLFAVLDRVGEEVP